MRETLVRRRPFVAIMLTLVLAVVGSTATVATHALPDAEVTVGSADGVMLQNKQNEPTVAINPMDPDVVAAGANDNIDLEGCNVGDDTTCPFTQGVGGTGFQFSSNGGASWIQPTYSGYSTRHCVGAPGPGDSCTARTPSSVPAGQIGTPPWYFENGLVSDGDPVLAFGPKPGPGGFNWSNGERLYYANLTSSFSGARNDTVKGFEGIAVSRIDDPTAANIGDKDSWMPPVIASRQTGSAFSDKEAIWADNAASSRFFGNVYICYAAFNSVGGGPEPIRVGISKDGGDTWENKKLSPSANTRTGQGRQGCAVRTDSGGVVFVFWLGGAFGGKDDPPFANNVIFLSRSFDGGTSWEKPRAVANVNECGRFDANTGRLSFDGIGGARTNSFPSVDIANGAPNGFTQPHQDTIVLTWCDGPTPTVAGGTNERALVQISTNRGVTWSGTVNGAESSDRPDFPAIAISPDGTDVYLVYMGFHIPWQSTTAAARMFEGVVRHANVTGSPLSFTTVHRGFSGDARGSTQNGLVAGFLGDYNTVAATNDFAVAVWNDARNATNCPAIDTFRQNLAAGVTPNPTPAPQQDCPVVGGKVFGNSDIFGTRINDPS